MLKLLFIDLETTGTDPTKHGVVQIAGQIYIDGEEQERFDMRAKPLPGQLVSKEALDHTGLTIEMLREFPEPMEAFQQFRRLLGRYVNKFDRLDKFYFIAYNAAFDYNFLRKWYETLGDKFFGSWIWFPYVDVMTLASQALMASRPGMTNFKLATVAKEFDIEVDESQCHDAQYDIDVTKQLYSRVVKRLQLGSVAHG